MNRSRILIGVLFWSLVLGLPAWAQPGGVVTMKTMQIPKVVQVPAAIKEVRIPMPQVKAALSVTEDTLLKNATKVLVSDTFGAEVGRSMAVHPTVESVTKVGNRLKVGALVVFLAKDTYTATISKVDYETEGSQVFLTGKIDNYAPQVKAILTPGAASPQVVQMKKDVLANLKVSLPQGTGPKAMANTPCDNIASAVTYTNKVNDTFVKAFGSAEKKIGAASTKASVLDILKNSNRLVAWNNIGHGNPSCIVEWNGEPIFDSDFNSSTLFAGIYQSVILLNSCQTCASPYNLKNAIKKHNPRTYIAGSVNLPIGASEQVDNDFWDMTLMQAKDMATALATAQQNHGLTGYFCLDGFSGKFAEVEAGKMTEDCIPFNPAQVQAQKVGNNWKVVQGSMWMLDFGAKQQDAEKAAKIIKFYKMDKQCFVGRPNAPMMYFTVQGKAPVGPYAGEDAVPFNTNNVTAANIGGNWKVVDGSHWIMDFGAHEAQAKTAVQIIKYYGFNHICFVGRPHAPMIYFRK